jgi:biopolymer transport protein ExbB
MDIMYYIDKGGVIMYILLALNVIGFTIMIVKFIQYMLAKSKTNSIVNEVYENISQSNLEAQATLSRDVLAEKMVHYERGLSTVRIIASIAPLLGLLGTVVGVLGAFEAISKQGLGDPSVFASGISLALITTVGGLIVAIPHYVGYNYLIGMLDRLEVSVGKEMSCKIYEDKL